MTLNDKNKAKIIKKIISFCKNDLMVELPDNLIKDAVITAIKSNNIMDTTTAQYYHKDGKTYEIIGKPICRQENKLMFYKNEFTREPLVLKSGTKILFGEDTMEIVSSSEMYKSFSYKLEVVPKEVNMELANNELSMLYCREYLGFKVLNAEFEASSSEKVEIAMLLGDIFHDVTYNEFKNGFINRKFSIFDFKYDAKSNNLYVLKNLKIIPLELFCTYIYVHASNGEMPEGIN